MIHLLQFRVSDYPRLISWIDSPELLLQFAGPAFTYPLTAEQLECSCQDINRHCYKAVFAETTKVVGHGEIYLKGTTAWLGRILIGEKALQHQGLGQQLVRALLTLCFDKFGCDLVKLNVFEKNTAAIRCYQACGFTINPEGAFERPYGNTVWKGVQMHVTRQDLPSS
ncbi:MAG TPA: GNAT family protein [Flavisolibacter sp.]|jgi:RimJ/RimL family protein N-acetyltransferase|nr:GNAT family protein [Flavisolibacter sp.]